MKQMAEMNTAEGLAVADAGDGEGDVVEAYEAGDAGWIVTFPTGTATTVMLAVSDLPSSEEATFAEPGAMPVTRPPAETTATAEFVDVHVGRRSVTVAPDSSVSVAESCTVPPR